MTIYRLKESHETFQKVNKLFAKAEELGITIDFYGHKTVVTDHETNKSYDLYDLETIRFLIPHKQV